jgi:hypothetical protein
VLSFILSLIILVISSKGTSNETIIREVTLLSISTFLQNDKGEEITIPRNLNLLAVATLANLADLKNDKLITNMAYNALSGYMKPKTKKVPSNR